MNFYGVVIAVITFMIIGVFHPIVIKAEYHLTERCWPLFLAAGIVLIGGKRAGVEHDAFVRARRDGMQLYVEHKGAAGTEGKSQKRLVPGKPGEKWRCKTAGRRQIRM